MARKPKIRAPYLMVSPPTWELARADYLGGMTAQQVADKHGIGLHNLRQTMARKGWTKRALADARATAGPGGPPVTAASAGQRRQRRRRRRRRWRRGRPRSPAA